DDFGDKQADVVFPSWGGTLLVSVAPVLRNNELVGAIAISVPIEAVTTQLSSQAGSKAITLYRTDGSLITSTVHANPGTLGGALGITGEQAQQLLGGQRVVVRKATVDERPFVETLGALAVRQKPVLVM